MPIKKGDGKGYVYQPSDNPDIFDVCIYSDKNFQSYSFTLDNLQELRTAINKAIINRKFNKKE